MTKQWKIILSITAMLVLLSLAIVFAPHHAPADIINNDGPDLRLRVMDRQSPITLEFTNFDNATVTVTKLIINGRPECSVVGELGLNHFVFSETTGTLDMAATYALKTGDQFEAHTACAVVFVDLWTDRGHAHWDRSK